MHTPSNGIFSRPIARLLSVLGVLIQILSHADAKKKAKKKKKKRAGGGGDFEFGTFIGRFQVTPWQ